MAGQAFVFLNQKTNKLSCVLLRKITCITYYILYNRYYSIGNDNTFIQFDDKAYLEIRENCIHRKYILYSFHFVFEV